MQLGGYVFTNGSSGSGQGWAKSSFCSTGTCVEISGRVRIADSKQDAARRSVLEVDATVWNGFISQISEDVSSIEYEDLSAEVLVDGSAVITDGDIRLTFTEDEWKAFASGVADGQLRSLIDQKVY